MGGKVLSAVSCTVQINKQTQAVLTQLPFGNNRSLETGKRVPHSSTDVLSLHRSALACAVTHGTAAAQQHTCVQHPAGGCQTPWWGCGCHLHMPLTSG